jgi:hypothetical protein
MPEFFSGGLGRRSFSVLAAVLAGVCPIPASGQAASLPANGHECADGRSIADEDTAFAAFGAVRHLVKEGHVIAAWCAARQMNRSAATDRRGLAQQLMIETASFLGDEPETFALAKQAGFFRDADELIRTLAAMPQLRSVPADQAILRRSHDVDFTIINNSHFDREHHVLVMGLLPRLYAQGYRVIAVEAFEPGAPEAGGRPQTRDGYYLNDPALANLVMVARAIGFSVISYDYGYQDRAGGDALAYQQAREDVGTANILEKVRQAGGGRTLILAGFDHLLKDRRPSRAGPPFAWLAQVLTEKTGRPVLSVDQTTLMSVSEAPSIPGALGREVAALREPVVFLDGHDAPVNIGRMAGRVDLEVIHPPRPPACARPPRAAPPLQAVAVKPQASAPLIIESAAQPGEVPFDRLVWRKDCPTPSLLATRHAVIVQTPLSEP